MVSFSRLPTRGWRYLFRMAATIWFDETSVFQGYTIEEHIQHHFAKGNGRESSSRHCFEFQLQTDTLDYIFKRRCMSDTINYEGNGATGIVCEASRSEFGLRRNGVNGKLLGRKPHNPILLVSTSDPLLEQRFTRHLKQLFNRPTARGLSSHFHACVHRQKHSGQKQRRS